MATDKNITMKQFNGTDYDTLYPKTIASQIPDVYSKSYIDSILKDKARIQTGSYVGTGTYGRDNPCSLTFDFVPKHVQIYAFENMINNFIGLFYYSPQKMFNGQIYRGYNNNVYWNTANLSVSVDGNTITWYEGSNSDYQLNYNDTPYYYVAIG